jgi:hypothetical protein
MQNMQTLCVSTSIPPVGHVGRDERGLPIAEFVSALGIFIFFVLIPLADLTAMPVRFLIGYSMILDFTHKLSLSETRSQAITLAGSSSSYEQMARQLGVPIGNSELSVLCKNNKSETLTVENNKPIPRAWLPGGTKGPCTYLLQNKVKIKIEPLLSLGLKVAGITAPLSVTLQSDAPWKNLSCDPLTREFYINE